MKETNYLNYTSKELLRDDFFLNSHLYPTDESILFWNELKTENEQFSHEIDKALLILQSVPFRQNSLNIHTQKELFSHIQQTIRSEKKKKSTRKYLYALSAAASIALVCFLSWYYVFDQSDEILISGIEAVQKPMEPITQIQLIDEQNHELILDGDMLVITHDEEGKLFINSEGMDNTASQPSGNKQTSQYNQLIIPSGKRSFLTLSDGTKIWLNANSRIVYPKVFEKERREILVEGEAYLEVARDEQRPFFVKTRDLNVKVLGTSFNISAYDTDQNTSVVLVNGKVSVNSENIREKVLSPNEMLSLENGKMTTTVVNVENYISWRKGTYTFDCESFPIVLKRISRYYGKEIVWNREVEAIYCSGSLDLKGDIYQLLERLQEAIPVLFKENENRIEVNVKP